MSWHEVWAILHILAAVAAFGPTFIFPMVAAKARRDPAHAAFATDVVTTIADKVTLPLALTLPVSGIGLILTSHIDFWASEWLLVSIVLYAVGVVYSVVVERPRGIRLLHLLRSAPPGPPPEGSGPPPEVAALGRKMQMGGMVLTIITVAIFVLMIWQPGA